jgi:hypothetical protein
MKSLLDEFLFLFFFNLFSENTYIFAEGGYFDRYSYVVGEYAVKLTGTLGNRGTTFSVNSSSTFFQITNQSLTILYIHIVHLGAMSFFSTLELSALSHIVITDSVVQIEGGGLFLVVNVVFFVCSWFFCRFVGRGRSTVFRL